MPESELIKREVVARSVRVAVAVDICLRQRRDAWRPAMETRQVTEENADLSNLGDIHSAPEPEDSATCHEEDAKLREPPRCSRDVLQSLRRKRSDGAPHECNNGQR